MDYSGLARIGQVGASTAASASTTSGDSTSTSGVYTDDQMLPSAAAAASLASYAQMLVNQSIGCSSPSSIYVYNVPGTGGVETDFEALNAAAGEYAYYETTGATVHSSGTLNRRRCSVGPLEPSPELMTSGTAVPQELPMDQMYVQFINKRDVDTTAEKVLSEKNNSNNSNRTVRIGEDYEIE